MNCTCVLCFRRGTRECIVPVFFALGEVPESIVSVFSALGEVPESVLYLCYLLWERYQRVYCTCVLYFGRGTTEVLFLAVPPSRPENDIFFKVPNRVHKFDVNNGLWFVGSGNIKRIFTKDNIFP